MGSSMKKAAAKNNPILDLKKRKLEANKEVTSGSFGKFSYKKPRNSNNSNVGPAWGPRKGN